MEHTLMKLPYGYDALEPMMSQETLHYHYDKHHAGYVTKLNKFIEETVFASKTLEEIIQSADGAIFNNASQVFNHNFFWKSLSNQPTNQSTYLTSKIEEKFGSQEDFKKAFIDVAVGVFGSGWVWLCLDKDNQLTIEGTSNANTPLTTELKPLMVCDVWEHAYYIDYRNARPDYLENFWKLINWDFVSSNLENAS
jgi:Fe-Mn family superoxide dismutase